MIYVRILSVNPPRSSENMFRHVLSLPTFSFQPQQHTLRVAYSPFGPSKLVEAGVRPDPSTCLLH